MTLDSAIARFRAREQELMRSECTVERAAGGTYDDETMTWSNTPETVYEDICQVRPAGLLGSDENQGDDETRTLQYTVKLIAETDVQTGDVVTVTASSDAGMVDRVFRITDAPADEWQINRKCSATEVVQRGPSR